MMTQGDSQSQFPELTHLVIDGEASPAEQDHFSQQLAQSVLCQEEFEQEKSFIHLVRQSMKRTAAPAELLQRITRHIEAEVHAETRESEASFQQPMTNY